MDVMEQRISRDDFMTAIDAGIDPIRLYLYYKKTFHRELQWCLLQETYLISAVQAAVRHFRRKKLPNFESFVHVLATRGHVYGLSWYGALACDAFTISEQSFCRERAHSLRLFT